MASDAGRLELARRFRLRVLDLNRFRGPQHAFRFGQFLRGEKARLSVPDPERELAVHPTVVMEEEKMFLSVFRMGVDMNVKAERVAGLRERRVISRFAAQEPVSPLAA